MLLLVRHGRTPANAAGLLQGRLDQELDEVGVRQVAALAAMVGDVDRVIASPLLRARQTADAFGRPVEIDERWIEVAYGELEGASIADPTVEVIPRWMEDPTWRPPGGESLADLDARVRPALVELAEEARHRDVAVVSHVSPIKAAIAWTLGVGLEISFRTHLTHASICRVEVRSYGPVLTSFNETAPAVHEPAGTAAGSDAST